MDVIQEFSVRCYRWAVLDAQEEMEAGFPMISRLGSNNAKTYLSVMSDLDAARRQRLVTAFVKRFHPQAVELLGDGMSSDDESLLGWADGQRLEMSCAIPAPALRISRRKLETLLKSELLARFGRQTPLTDTGPKMFRFELSFGSWVVTTRFDCGRRPEYFHEINGKGVVLMPILSIASWMGISSGTDWTHGRAGSEKDIAATMIEAVRRFLSRAPELLEGLSP